MVSNGLNGIEKQTQYSLTDALTVWDIILIEDCVDEIDLPEDDVFKRFNTQGSW